MSGCHPASQFYRAKTRSPIRAFPRLAFSLLHSLGTIHGRIARRLRRMVCACKSHEPRGGPQKKAAALGRCQRAHIPDQEPSAHQSRSMESWTRVRRVRFQEALLHRGTADEPAAPPFSLAFAPPAACIVILVDKLSQTSLASGRLVRVLLAAAEPTSIKKAPRLVSRKVERKTWVLHIIH
jgi:hypothetical protein